MRECVQPIVRRPLPHLRRGGHGVSGPLRLFEAEPGVAGHEGLAGAAGGRGAVEPDQRKAAAVVARQDAPQAAPAGGDRGFGGRRRAVEAHRHDAAARGAAVLHARHHLLADEAALGEADAVELVEIGLVGKHLARTDVALGVGDSQCHAMGVILAGIGGRGRFERRGGADGAMAQAGGPGIAEDACALDIRRVVAAPDGGDGEIGLRRNLDLAAQAVHRQALDEVVGAAGRGIEQEAGFGGQREHVEEDLALGRQQGAVGPLPRLQRLDIAGQQRVQEVARFAALEAQNRAAGQNCDGNRH
jgi:hypothetical protein